MRLLCLLLFMASTPAWGASFPCKKARTTVEKLVCVNARLSALDDQLAVAFRKAKASDEDVVVEDQGEWLHRVRDRCRDVACLEKAYRERIDFLVHWHDPIPWKERLDGRYETPRMIEVFDGEKWEKGPSSDCLSLKSLGGDLVYLQIESFQTNGHSCSVEGKARHYSQGYQLIPDDDSECRLMLRTERGALVVDDPERQCQDHCGMRAGLHGLSWRTDRRQPKGGSCTPD